MTKKHFEAIAHTLNANFAPMALVLDFADMCEEMSDRFDRQMFVLASTRNLIRVCESEARILAIETT